MEPLVLGTSHVITNFDALATTPLRSDALTILEAGYRAIDTKAAIRRTITLEGGNICVGPEQWCLADFERVFVVGIGKCAVDAAAGLEEVLGDVITGGIILDVKTGVFSHMRSFVGTHPFPSDGNIAVTRAIADLVRGATEKDLVIAVISGGGSSLLCLPNDITCGLLSEITEVLWEGGATIAEVNVVRKHLSQVQGGNLAKLAAPATVLGLVFSDVPGDDLALIASGPTVYDPSTVADAEAILAKYHVYEKCPIPPNAVMETPKDHGIFAQVRNIFVVTNAIGLDAMAEKARALGYAADIRSATFQGIAREIGTEVATAPMPHGACFLWGGETTVHLAKDHGEGGRNRELALAASSVIRSGRVVVAAASDGWDNGPAAGALADVAIHEKIVAIGGDPSLALSRNDSALLVKQSGGEIVTGRTGANVADFLIVLETKEA